VKGGNDLLPEWKAGQKGKAKMLRQNFNFGWTVDKDMSPFERLIMGAAAAPKEVTLPHDAMIMGKRYPDKPTAGGIAYFETGNVVYTKTFFVPAEDEGKIIYIEFEGVYMNASVWVNEDFAGKHTYGYSNFYVKINDFLRYGEENTIKVLAKNGSQPNARWYSGTGIYRNVKLMIADPLHINIDGVMISTPDIRAEVAVVETATEVVNEGVGFKSGHVVTEIKDAKGRVVAKEKTGFTCFSGSEVTVRQRIYVKKPILWDLDNPYLYTCETRIELDGKIIDEDKNTFGIRSLTLDPVSGLQLNGKTVKLKGGCIHHDNGILGATTFEDAEFRRAKLHKEAGYNSLRSAHHPMSKAMLDACDKLGLLVMEEFSDVWTQAKNDFDYSLSFPDSWEEDVELMVKKDFNHPCVVFYSIGNEISEVGSDRSVIWGRKIAEKIRSLDSTRFITNGINVMNAIANRRNEILKSMGIEIKGKGLESGEINQIMADMREAMNKFVESPQLNAYIEESCGMLDVIGYNYATSRYENEPKISPNRIVVGAETFPSALDVNWELVTKHGYILGDYSWTSWDYLGEVGIGHVGYDDDRNKVFYGDYPWITAYCADFDITGYRRPISYWREIIWGGRNHKPYIAVQRPERYGQKTYPSSWGWTDSISSWTWPGFEGKNIVVEVYSDAEEIELFINGKSKGKKPVGDEFKKFYCKFDTIYEAGQVEAVAYTGGNEVGWYSLVTAGVPKLSVKKERDSIRAGTNDLCYVNIELVDDNGILNTAVKKSVTVSLEGAGILQASGSGNPRMEEYYYENTHETFYGRMLAIVRAGIEKGTAKLTVSAEGMDSVTVEIPVV
jgi:beta-galactosidase